MENLYISLSENKISKSLGILHWAKFLLNQKLGKMFIFLLYSYIDYDNMAWGSTPKTKLKKIFTFQKKAARVIFFANRLAHAKPLMLDLNAFNVYQINIYQNFYFIKRRYSLISFQRSVIIIRQVPKKLAIIQFLNRQWN